MYRRSLWLISTRYFPRDSVKHPAYAASLMLASPLLFAALAVLLGKEAGWDLQNYHWYDPYALLTQRLGFDIAVAHHATYYNPLIDVPFYWIATHTQAWLAGAFLGALFGVAVALVGAITYQVIACRNTTWRIVIAALIAIAGAIGGGAFPALGNTSNDVPVAIGVLAALWILTRNFSQLRSISLKAHIATPLLSAGICAGISVGLKLTTAIYALGLLIAILVTATTWRKRGFNFFLLGIGMFLGFVACAGPWLWRMWEYGRNPLFPYFNQLFHSPLLVEGSYRDTAYINAHDWVGKLILPYLFTRDSFQVAEWHFRDAHILVAYVVVPLSLLIMVIHRQLSSPASSPSLTVVPQRLMVFLTCFAAVSYLCWLLLFGIYRYLIPLEMLSPLLIAIGIALWPIVNKARIAITVVVLIAAQTVVTTTIERYVWDDMYVRVQVPPLADPEHSMVLMIGTSPMAFVIPSFPSAIPFLRVDGWMVWKDDVTSGLARQMHARIAAHTGPLLMMYSPWEAKRAVETAQAYNLKLLPDTCAPIRSNIADALQLCQLQRL